jgi:hypothetical protein
MYLGTDKVNITFRQLNDLVYKHGDYYSDGIIDLIYSQHIQNECYNHETLFENNEKEKTVKTIIINGNFFSTILKSLSRNQIICWAFNWSYGTMSEFAYNKFTLTYRFKNKEGGEKSGSLQPGEIIKVVDGMKFDVADTSNA